ncbi:MAG: O-antigen ligase family protein, partial [Bacteroidota bacterium]|nr:O-antigen ligase family protein [Bacteroidota bacterium]
MIEFLRYQFAFILIALSWVVVAIYGQAMIYAWLPITILFMKSRDQWPELLVGLLLFLVLSDMDKAFQQMAIVKGAKNVFIILLASLFLLERNRFFPFSRVFNIFLPFFIYSFFPLIWSKVMFLGVQKTISYGLMFLIIPNYVLYNFRLLGWQFFKNLLQFMACILIAGVAANFFGDISTDVAGRFRGLFGNPNGMAIYCYLCILLLTVVLAINKEALTFKEKAVLYVIFFYFLIISGSRSSLAATLIFVVFQRSFSYSPFLGFVLLLGIFGVAEVISSNLQPIILALGLEEYFRLNTLEDGSGRYFAWEFAWGHIQNFLVFGGGFANDEALMKYYRLYLERMGHQGGVHNSYLSFWLNVGIVGLAIYLRSFFLLFIKASKMVPMSLAVMFSVLFSIM